MGFFDFFKSSKKDDTNREFGFISKDKNKGLSFEEAQKMRDHFLSIMSENDRNKEFNAASGMMLKQAYDASIEAYNLLAQKYPDSLGLCESQIGVGYFFKEEYEKAISYYVFALQHGENKDMMDDNIWEACEVLYQNTQDKQHIEKYKEIFPNGNYLSKANKILK